MGWKNKINQINCQDCLELMQEMPDNCIDLVITDPPYGMNYVSSRRKHSFNVLKNDDNLEWFENFIKKLFRIMKNNTHGYIFCNDYSFGLFRNEIINAGFKIKRALIWIKNNHTSGDLYGDYANKTEFILFFHKGRKELFGKRNTNIINYSRLGNLKHPTEKPKELMAFFIKKSSKENDLIFDPFMGSWTTAVASRELNRNFIGAEINEEYCKIGKDRLKQQVLI